MSDKENILQHFVLAVFTSSPHDLEQFQIAPLLRGKVGRQQLLPKLGKCIKSHSEVYMAEVWLHFKMQIHIELSLSSNEVD